MAASVPQNSLTTDYIEFSVGGSELRVLSEMNPGSINALVSPKPLRRPPSLSESFAWSAENVERAMRNAPSNTSLDLLVATTTSTQGSPESPRRLVQPQPQQRCRRTEVFLTQQALRFLFHIALISVFETVFFFLYVSTLEDNGINHTVDGFLGGFESSCRNFTPLERNLTNDALAIFLNATTIVAQGQQAAVQRAVQNDTLFQRAWIYVGGLGGLFVLSVAYTLLRRIQVAWGTLVAENLVFVAMLAGYEYMFFSTVIFPYTPITAPEIAANTVLELQTQCGLFTLGVGKPTP